MFAGVEFDLIPAVLTSQQKSVKSPKKPKAWLAGEIIVRCENQRLEELPEPLFQKTSARQLIFTGNLLRSIPVSIGNLKELRILRFGYNQLTELPDEICQLEHLEKLELDHNQLQILPANLCRLVHLELINLDANPLSGRFAPEGPTLHELWAPPPPAKQAASEDQQQKQSDGEDGGEAPDQENSTPDAAGSSQPRQIKPMQQPSLKSSTRHKAATQRVLGYLVTLQAPEDAMRIKQAQLVLLQAAAKERIIKLRRIADPAGLAACMETAKDSGLEDAEVAAVAAAQAAVAGMQAAMEESDKEKLGAALRHFETLCRPGRPDGPVYKAAHTSWRQLQQQALARGWRSSSGDKAATAASDADAGRLGGGDAGAAAGDDGESGKGAATRSFMTMQVLRKQQLKDAGALSYDQWVREKKEEERGEKAALEAAIAVSRREKARQVIARADKALDNCEKERQWPSRCVEAYPRGTFSPPPEHRKVVREMYASPTGVPSSSGAHSRTNSRSRSPTKEGSS